MPKELTVGIDVLSLHFDPEIWGPVDPNVFHPERFSVKRNPLAFMAFGAGPRNCIGMKFAMVELKIALCKLLLKYEFLTSENQPDKFEIL